VKRLFYPLLLVIQIRGLASTLEWLLHRPLTGDEFGLVFLVALFGGVILIWQIEQAGMTDAEKRGARDWVARQPEDDW
jgi:hypothetical protein